MASETAPNFEEVRLGLEAAKVAGAKCFRYQVGDRVMVFELADAGAPRTAADQWFEAKRGTS